MAKAVILKRKKDKCTVFIEFDLDTMEGFRIKKQVRIHSIMPVFILYSFSYSLLQLFWGLVMGMMSFIVVRRFTFSCLLRSHVC